MSVQEMDAAHGAAIRRERQAVGWTQTDLAVEMQRRGFSFHQQTVDRIEQGQRPLRLTEAVALADLLGYDAGPSAMLSGSTMGIRRRLRLERLDAEIAEARARLAELLDERSRLDEAAEVSR